MVVLFGKLLFGVVSLHSFLSLDFFFRLSKGNSPAFSQFLFLFLGPGPISTHLSPATVTETQQGPSLPLWSGSWYGKRCLLSNKAVAPFSWVLLTQRLLGPIGKELD